MTINTSLERTGTRFGSFGALAAAVAAALAGPQLASAQEQAEEVIVTGSRVSRSGFDSPQPVTAINAEQIENLGLVNVGDIARTLPQNTPFFSETNVGVGNFNVGAQLANLRGLNPFFGTRTLTLVDTRRVVPNSEGSSVDLTLIPSVLVERMDVVTGGASAAYGSDAIAGVVNVILDKDLDGFKAQLDYGQTTESDGDDMHASFGFGMPFGDSDRGHLLIGGEFQEQDPIGPVSQGRPQQVANAHRRHADLLSARLEANQVRRLQLQLRRVLDHDQSVVRGQEGRERVEQGGLARPRPAADQDVVARLDAAP